MAHRRGTTHLQLPALAQHVRRTALHPAYWPDVDRRDLWQSITIYTKRQRRYGTIPTRGTGPLPGPRPQDTSERTGQDAISTLRHGGCL
ncbi:hypothetical protein QA811_43405 [Streptomyces sp. B21-102]|uniref:hypothetical protein n=1 Tax=Streptomyces sp. B21-102 TaxID=3039416 RepID=UPI002FF253CD